MRGRCGFAYFVSIHLQPCDFFSSAGIIFWRHAAIKMTVEMPSMSAPQETSQRGLAASLAVLVMELGKILI